MSAIMDPRLGGLLSQDLRQTALRARQCERAGWVTLALTLGASGALAGLLWAAEHTLPAASLEAVHWLGESTEAAGPGSEFMGVTQALVAWTTGVFAKMLAISVFILGMGLAIVRQNALHVLAAMGMALMLSNGPRLMLSLSGLATVQDDGQLVLVEPAPAASSTPAAPAAAWVTAYHDGQRAVQAGDAAAARQAWARLGPRREGVEQEAQAIRPEVLYAIEVLAFGEPRSAATRGLVAEAVRRAEGYRAAAQGALLVAGALGLLAGYLRWLAWRMHSHVERFLGGRRPNAHPRGMAVSRDGFPTPMARPRRRRAGDSAERRYASTADRAHPERPTFPSSLDSF